MFVLGLIVGMCCGFVAGAMLARPSSRDLEILLQYEEEAARRNGW